jgi:hypothetical protein
LRECRSRMRDEGKLIAFAAMRSRREERRIRLNQHSIAGTVVSAGLSVERLSKRQDTRKARALYFT